MRPDIGTQDDFRKKEPPTTYRYDSSLSPALDWDGQNGARELGEWLVACIEDAAKRPAPHAFDQPRTFTGNDGRVRVTVHTLKDAVDALKRLGKPLLTWTGKAERLSFDVPTLPLFVHERLHPRHRRHAGRASHRQAAVLVRPVRRPAALHRRPGRAPTST